MQEDELLDTAPDNEFARRLKRTKISVALRRVGMLRPHVQPRLSGRPTLVAVRRDPRAFGRQTDNAALDSVRTL